MISFGESITDYSVFLVTNGIKTEGCGDVHGLRIGIWCLGDRIRAREGEVQDFHASLLNSMS